MFLFVKQKLLTNPVVILLLYFLIAILLTWPMILVLNTHSLGDYADTRGGIWDFWVKSKNLIENNTYGLIGAPFGVPVATLSQPVTEYFTIILSKILNEIAGHSLFIFFSFVFSAYTQYWVLLSFTKNNFASFIGGFIFGFAPAAVLQSIGGHSAFAFNIFISLFFHALFYNRRNRTYLSAFYVGVSFAGITLTSLYFGYFCIYLGLFFIAFDFLTCGRENKNKICMNYMCGALSATVLVLPFIYQDLLIQVNSTSNTLLSQGKIRDFNELAVYSARLWEYLVPSIDHPILGAYLERFVQLNLHGSNVPEQTLYLGFVPMCLFITGTFLVAQKKLNKIHRNYYLFFAFGVLLMVFLSLPPLLKFGYIEVPTLSYFAYKLVPMFRVYSRFGILVIFFLSSAVAIVLTHLKSMPSNKYYLMILLLMPILFFEYWSISPNQIYNVSNPPEVYKWLASQKEDFLIVEYPMMLPQEVSFSNYLFWQRIHKKKMVNGASPGQTEAWQFFQKIKDISDPTTPILLNSVGVKYVLIHKQVYRDGPISSPIKRYFNTTIATANYNDGKTPPLPTNLKLVKSFGDDLVFAINLGALKGAL